MSTNAPDNPEFQGKDLKECERFIAAVNKHARAEGKLRDDQWIADFVAICLAGDALIWWSLLDEETQGSWRLLRQAMISRFTSRPLFYGKSGAEAEDFVYQIRQRALHVGKLNDPSWTAEFASGCFVGSALRWYTTLESGIREDWDSLQQAIFVQYRPEFEDDSLLSTVPTPALAAAAPDATRSRRRGRIRVSREGDSNLYYLSKVLYGKKPQEGRVMVTTAIVDALEVECETLHDRNSPQILSIPDNQIEGCDALGMQWADTNTMEANLLVLCGVKSSFGTGSGGEMFDGSVVTKAWKISWSGNDQEVGSVLGVTESGGRLLCLSDRQSPNWMWLRTSKPSDEIDLELFFELVLHKSNRS